MFDTMEGFFFAISKENQLESTLIRKGIYYKNIKVSCGHCRNVAKTEMCGNPSGSASSFYPFLPMQ